MFNGREPRPLSMDISSSFVAKIANGNITVGIIGLGYVGLPTAIGFLDAGFEVWVSMFHSEVERKPPPICYEADLLLF